MPDPRPVIQALLDAIQPHAQPVAYGAGAAGALLALILIWRFLRTGHTHDKLGTVAVGLATLFAMEGMFEVAHGPLGLNLAGSLMFCATFEVVMLHQGSLAAYKLTQDPAADIRRHMTFVWIVAAASGVIASTASNSVTEVVLRLTTPPLAAGIWYMSLYADRPVSTQQTSWIWTPRRIGIHLGLIQPGEQDLVKVDRDRRIDAMTVTAHRLHHGSPRLAWFRRARLRRLALQADDAMVTEAQRRVARVHRIEALTSPAAVPPAALTTRERDLLDEVRLSTRQAARTIRSDLRLVHGVRMPAAIADQIPDQIPDGWADQRRTRLADQTVDQAQPAGVDHPVDHTPDQTSAPDRPVDQTLTRASLPAARTTTPARTTARVDRARPVSPAAGGEVPPRIRDMVRDLKRAYRGDIPGRRVVMDRMRWTSAGDAQTAINLVRSERAARTKTND